MTSSLSIQYNIVNGLTKKRCCPILYKYEPGKVENTLFILPGKTFSAFVLFSPSTKQLFMTEGSPGTRWREHDRSHVIKTVTGRALVPRPTKTPNSWTVTSLLCVSGRGSHSRNTEPTVTVRRPGGVPTTNSCYIVDLTEMTQYL